MKNGIYEIVSNRPIALDTYEMVLAGDMGFVENPGQFVNIQLEGLYLRRPISICDWDDRTMTLIYKVVGRGTRQMAAMAPGHKLDLLTGLGNGFSMEEAGEHSLVIGGGVGVPPLYGLCKRLVQQGKRVSAVLGFGKQEQVFYQKEFEELGCPVYLATEDGSMGTKGWTTTIILPAAPCPCCGPCMPWAAGASSPLKSGWAAALAPAWAAAVRLWWAQNAFVSMAL